MKTSTPGTTASRMKLNKVFAVVSSATFAETSFVFPSFTPTTAVLPEGPGTLEVSGVDSARRISSTASYSCMASHRYVE